MGRWLVKSDPASYGWADLVRDRTTVWDGVANALALKHLGGMRRGDDCLIYESGAVKAVVGLARVARAPRPDPAAVDPRRLVVDLTAVASLPTPVALSALKADPAFAAFALVRQPRLSVLPVPAALWRRLLRLGGA